MIPFVLLNKFVFSSPSSSIGRVLIFQTDTRHMEEGGGGGFRVRVLETIYYLEIRV